MILRLLSHKVDEAAVARRLAEHYMIRFANNEITVFKTWTTEDLWVYMCKAKRYTTVTMTGGLNLERLEQAVKALDATPQDPLYVPLEGLKPRGLSEKPEDVEKMVDLVKRAIDAARGVERNAGVVSLSYISVSYEDTAGGSGNYSLNRVYMAMRSFLGELSATAARAGRRAGEIKAEELGESNARLLEAARGLPATRVEMSKSSLVLSPMVLGHLMAEIASMWASGSEVLAGTSRYSKEDLGREAASPALTLVEKTYDPNSYGHVSFDLEGVEPRPVEIYRRGVLSGFIHTRRTARALSQEPTGHALGHVAFPRPGHIAISPGDAPDDLEQLLAELKNGYYIHNNWYTRFQNVKTGLFSTVGRDVALEVKDGKPVAVVKYIRIADTLENVARNIYALSRRAYPVYWWDMPAPADAPYALVRDITITT